MSLILREYTPADFEAVTRVWRRALEDNFPEFMRTKGHTPEEDRAYFRDVILVRNRVWLAELDGQVCGFMAIQGDLIDHLYIDPDFQRRGIGKALLEHARSLSPDSLFLYTFQSNARGRAFYEKNGFRAVRFGVSPPPESEPDVEYRWP
jgi:ribosomal protein S18 acetylase RimI-like enzyme